MSDDPMLEDLKEQILSGEFDDVIDELYNTVQVRRVVLGGQKKREQTYVRIRPNAGISPKYMLGREFPLIRENKSTVTVGPIPNEKSYGRFAGLRSIRVPITAVEAI